MNGYHPNNIASSSSNPHPDFPQLNQPPFSNAMPMQHQHRPPPPQQMHLMSQSQNQWPHGMRPTPPSANQAPQHQQLNQPHWQNGQMQHPQAFSNGMPSNGMSVMGGFNMPFISQQIIQDAFALSAPVQPADEKMLLQALLDSRGRGETYKDALNSLHGKNGHAASLWKDYYLDNKDRLDEWITFYLNPPPKTALPENPLPKIALQTIKKPFPTEYKSEGSIKSPSSPPPKQPQKRPKLPGRPPQPAGGGRRSTINSLTAPAPVYGNRLPPPNAEVKIPDPPSRSPSPPTIVVPHRGRGNKYTPQDREFFLKFIAWRLKGDPTLTRNDLCELLAEKAPHHTVQSWASYWSNNHDVPDKILAAAKGEEYDNDEDSEKEVKLSIRKRPKYRDSSSDEDEEESETNESGEAAEDEVQSGNGDDDDDDDEDDDDDDEPIKSWSESEMGQKGSSFTDADFYITAKYVASFRNFDEVASKDRWQPYAEKHPMRSAKSWAEYYRRNEKVIFRLAKRIRKQAQAPELPSILTQRGQPGWASSRDVSQSYPKRKHSVEEDSCRDDTPGNRNKRGRGDEDETS